MELGILTMERHNLVVPVSGAVAVLDGRGGGGPFILLLLWQTLSGRDLGDFTRGWGERKASAFAAAYAADVAASVTGPDCF